MLGSNPSAVPGPKLHVAGVLCSCPSLLFLMNANLALMRQNPNVRRLEFWIMMHSSKHQMGTDFDEMSEVVSHCNG